MSQELWKAISAAVRIFFRPKHSYHHQPHLRVYTFITCNHLFSYHVPRSWFKPSGNILVLFEEAGGDPTQLSFATRETESICSRVSESHPTPIDMWTSDDETRKTAKPTLSLGCPFPNQVISKIKFASFGTPHGTCGSFSHGRCASKNALSVVEKVVIFDDLFGCCYCLKLFNNEIYIGRFA